MEFSFIKSTLSRPFVIIQFIDRLLILFTQCCISSPSFHQAGPGFGWCFFPVGVWEGWKGLYFLLWVRVTSWFIPMAGKEIFLWLPRAVESQSVLQGQSFHRVKGFWILPRFSETLEHFLTYQHSTASEGLSTNQVNPEHLDPGSELLLPRPSPQHWGDSTAPGVLGGCLVGAACLGKPELEAECGEGEKGKPWLKIAIFERKG